MKVKDINLKDMQDMSEMVKKIKYVDGEVFGNLFVKRKLLSTVNLKSIKSPMKTGFSILAGTAKCILPILTMRWRKL